MTQEEYNNIDWQRGNVVRLTNGKEYPVKKPKKRFLLLYSAEHESYFVANCDIIDCRTSDNVEPYPEKKPAEVKPEAKPARAQEPTPAVEEMPEPAPAAEAKPKRKRQRVTIKGTSVEKIVF
ncbi:MAG: hypothetical protein Q4D23_00830 [Bacteroidales bacterium]|nr:hypothetical protein [Bacteroidales bacterium]